MLRQGRSTLYSRCTYVCVCVCLAFVVALLLMILKCAYDIIKLQALSFVALGIVIMLIIVIKTCAL